MGRFPNTPIGLSLTFFVPGFSFLPAFRPFFCVFFGAVFFFLAIVISPFSKQRSLLWESEALSPYTERADRMSTTVTNRTERTRIARWYAVHVLEFGFPT
jgi:hypothetical protein